ncbi:transporter [Planctomycetaceae bacterium SH139]
MLARMLVTIFMLAFITLVYGDEVKSAGPLGIEFLDDFTKPREAQRQPFEERIETERHDFTQSATTVGRGITQVEAGYSFFFKETGSERETAHTLPETLIRIGLSEDIEMRFRLNHTWVFVEDKQDRIGAEDMRFSLKLQMTRECDHSLLPTSAVELRGLAPTGGEAFTTNRVEFSVDYIYQWTLYEHITLAGSTGFGTRGFGEFGILPDEPTQENFNVLSQSVALGLELSDKNTLYAEWYGLFSDGLEDEFTVSVVNAGLDHYVTDDLVLDFRLGVGLNQDSDDFFTGIGGGFRF